MGVSSSSCYHDSNQITKEELKPGDHIYSWRNANYAHHGIYVGNDRVIHYIGGDKNGGSFCSSLSKAGRVNEESLDSFLLGGGGLYAYRYGVTHEVEEQERGGTCTHHASDPSELVLRRARYHLLIGFGRYDILKNNCEDFAIHCKTGHYDPTRVTSGQAASVIGWRNKNFSVDKDFSSGDTACQCLDQTPYNIDDFEKIPKERLIAVSSTDGSESGVHVLNQVKKTTILVTHGPHEQLQVQITDGPHEQQLQVQMTHGPHEQLQVQVSRSNNELVMVRSHNGSVIVFT